MTTNDDWATRVAEVWASADEFGDNILREKIDALVAERPTDDPEAAYEAASVRDSTGLEAEAAVAYQREMDLGRGEPHRAHLRRLALTVVQEFFAGQRVLPNKSATNGAFLLHNGCVRRRGSAS